MMNQINNSMRSGVWFVIIGGISSILHYIIAVGLVNFLFLVPEYSNVVGFLCALPVSYLGHKKISFRCHKTRHSESLPKFMLVSISGFVANQLLVMLCLHFTSVPFWLSLALIMFIIAISTYLLSRFWAFKHC